MAKVGVWLIGAQGSLAATVVLGARALARRLATGGGLVTELPELAPLRLVGVGDLVFGGWDLAPTGLVAQARALAADDAAVPESLVAKLEAELRGAEARVRPGFADGGGPAARARKKRAFVPRGEALAATVERLGDDLDRFRFEQRLDTVIVVNVASTEPPACFFKDPIGVAEHSFVEHFRLLTPHGSRSTRCAGARASCRRSGRAAGSAVSSSASPTPKGHIRGRAGLGRGSGGDQGPGPVQRRPSPGGITLRIRRGGRNATLGAVRARGTRRRLDADVSLQRRDCQRRGSRRPCMTARTTSSAPTMWK